MPPLICPRSAILQSAAASIVAGIFEVTVSTAARIATFGLSTTERDSKIDGVLANINFVFQGGSDIDRAVRNDQNLVIGRNIHDEYVADAACRAQSTVARRRPPPINSSVCRLPFISISARPSRMSSTAFSAAAWL